MRTSTWLDNVCQLLFIQADNHNESQSRVSQYFMTFASYIAFENYSTYELDWRIYSYTSDRVITGTLFYLIKYSDDSLDRRGNQKGENIHHLTVIVRRPLATIDGRIWEALWDKYTCIIHAYYLEYAEDTNVSVTKT